MARQMDLSALGYQFTRNWHRNRNMQSFREFVHPEWAGKPLTYLEIGVFEGQSLCWMMEHVLTHPDSRAVGVDPWLITTKLDQETMDAVRARAEHNAGKWPRATLVRGNSAEVLRRMIRYGFVGLKKDSVDVVMIDGNHNKWAVIDDAEQCIKLVRPGGWLLFDDVENQHEKSNHVKQALEDLEQILAGQIEEVWRHRFMRCYRRVG